jgi:hypothetical protein
MTVVIFESLFPRSSTTLHVTVTDELLPAATDGAVRVAVEVVPLTEPEVAL